MSWIRLRIDAWKNLSIVARTLLTTAALLSASALIVGATAFAAVSATRAVFPPPAEETLASATAASEVGGDGQDLDSAPGAKTDGAPKAGSAGRAKALSKPVQSLKRTQARRGEITE